MSDFPAPAFIYTVGSRMFGLNHENSDVDKIYVYVDFEMRLDPSERNPVYITSEQTDAEDIIYVELGEFLYRVERCNDMRFVEAFYCDNKDLLEVHDIALYEFMARQFQPYNYEKIHEMYKQEVKRRYKLFFGEKTDNGTFNPKNKNYNPLVGYNSKEASHLVRVLTAAMFFKYTGRVKTDMSADRDTYLKIIKGIPLEDLKRSVDSMLEKYRSIARLSDAAQAKLTPNGPLTSTGMYAEVVKSRLETIFDGNLL